MDKTEGKKLTKEELMMGRTESQLKNCLDRNFQDDFSVADYNLLFSAITELIEARSSIAALEGEVEEQRKWMDDLSVEKNKQLTKEGELRILLKEKDEEVVKSLTRLDELNTNIETYRASTNALLKEKDGEIETMEADAWIRIKDYGDLQATIDQLKARLSRYEEEESI